MNTRTTPLLIVKWNGYGVRFHSNICGKVFSLVAPEDGTKFETPLEAAKAARDVNIKPAFYEIVDAPEGARSIAPQEAKI